LGPDFAHNRRNDVVLQADDVFHLALVPALGVLLLAALDRRLERRRHV